MWVFIPPTNAESRKHTQANEGQDLPRRTCCQGGTNQEDGGKHDAQDDLRDENPDHKSLRVMHLQESIGRAAAHGPPKTYFFLASSRM